MSRKGKTKPPRPSYTKRAAFSINGRRPSKGFLELKELQASERTGSMATLSQPIGPYQGPKEFIVGDMKESGRARRVFTVRFDAKLHPPYGGFRIYFEDRQIGTALSPPSVEECMRLRRQTKEVSDGQEE